MPKLGLDETSSPNVLIIDNNRMVFDLKDLKQKIQSIDGLRSVYFSLSP